jgi:hypothetical protein
MTIGFGGALNSMKPLMVHCTPWGEINGEEWLIVVNSWI